LWSLHRRAYRAWLRGEAGRPGVVDAAEEPPHGTLLWIHGGRGAPAQFARLVAALQHRLHVAAFVYDDHGRLPPAAAALGVALRVLPKPVVLVAHSLGTLLPGWVGARDRAGRLRGVGAVYLNPLVGGSRHADADPVLAVLGSIRGLRWLHAVKHGIQRALFPSVVQDLTPESAFQQTIFGRDSAASSFAPQTRVLVTDRPRDVRNVRPERALHFFGRTPAALLERMGRRVARPPGYPAGHDMPLVQPAPTLAAIEEVLESVARDAPVRTSARGVAAL
jgi:hypothetical protein